ncbi:MAG: T9SS type A sorting domain-containing protein, partial [Cyclobacteriaceae bacterium]|nr:T9SS type A sorting domain-containing protein [Cyclobacteriaceae bacterium]
FGSSNQINTPLPVALIHFEVSMLSEDMLEFTWTTATELNNDYFEIEQSTDGIVWESILKISGAGTTKELTTYTVPYNDESCNERTYYKLSQVDEEGVEVDLQIVKVDRDRMKDVYVYPNPATTHIIIRGGEIKRVEIYDSNMQLLKTATKNIVKLDELNPGLYVACIHIDNRLVVRKFIRQ